jgi:hypothetical protein
MAGTRSVPGRVLSTLQGYGSAAVTAGQVLSEHVLAHDARLGGVAAYASTAGTGLGDTVLDVLKNGTSIWAATGDRPTLAATSTGAFANAAPSHRAAQAGDLLTLKVASISSTGHARVALAIALEDPGGGRP